MAGPFETSQESHRHLRRSRWPSFRPAFMTRRVGGRATRSPCAPPWRRPTSGSTNSSLAVGERLRAGCAAARATAAVVTAERTCAHNSQTCRPGLGAGEQQTQGDPR